LTGDRPRKADHWPLVYVPVMIACVRRRGGLENPPRT
jgi:hypothetical protein